MQAYTKTICRTDARADVPPQADPRIPHQNMQAAVCTAQGYPAALPYESESPFLPPPSASAHTLYIIAHYNVKSNRREGIFCETVVMIQ